MDWVAPTALDGLYEGFKRRTAEPLAAQAWPGNLSAELYSAARPQFVLPMARVEVERRAGEIVYDEYDAWAQSVGGVRAASVVIPIAITAGIPLVNFTGLQVRAQERREPVAGVWLAPNGAGDFFQRMWAADLDVEPVEQVAISDSSDVGAWSFPLSLGPADTVVAYVVASSVHHDVDFVVDLAYVDPVSGKAGTTTFDDNGRPYRVTAVAGTKDCFHLEVQTGRPIWGLTSDRVAPPPESS